MRRYCKKCGQISESETELRFCSHCGAEFEKLDSPGHEQSPGDGLPPAQPMAPKTSSEQPKYCPWEDKGRLGFINALYETWKESLFNAPNFFRRMPVTGGIANPFFYGIIFGIIGVVFSLMYQQLWGNLFDLSRFSHYMGRDFDWHGYEFARQLQSIGLFVQLIVSPFLIAASLFIGAGITHLILMIFGWKKENFEATFRVIAYSEGAYFFEIIPFIGGLISIVWAVVLYVTGLKEVHKLTVGQAILTIFLPFILCCLCCCGFVTIILGAAGFGH